MNSDVAIVGSGPAGLSAAIYSTRAGFRTTVYSGDTRGGLVTTTEKVDNYLGMPGMDGIAMAEAFLAHAESIGAKLVSASVERVEREPSGEFLLRLSNGEEKRYGAVIFAAGSEPRKLGVPGEELPGVSWCATCDGAFSAGEPVVVVGGGETAVEDATYLANIASSVTLLVRGDDFRATRPAVENLLKRENVSVRYNSSIAEIHGDGGVERVSLAEGGEIDCFSVFEAIGQVPQSQVAEGHVVLYENGFIEESSVEGFFVAGDVRNPEHRQIAVAVGDGAKSAMEAIKFLQSR